MQDSPGLDVDDDLFDLVADLVDGGVVGLVVWVEGKFCGFSFRVIMPSPMYPLSPIWRGGGVPSGRSVAGTSSSPQRRRASVSWTLPSWGSEIQARVPERVQAPGRSAP